MGEFDFCKSYMMADEKILWKGQPDAKIRFGGEVLGNLIFGIFWLAFSLFWCIGFSAGGGGILGWIFGMPFVAIGVYLVVGRPIHSAYLRGKTYYVITDMKIIRSRGQRVDTIDGRNLPQMQVKGFKDGYGNIYFGEQVVYRRNGKSYYGYSGGHFYLECVPIKDVQKALNEMIEANTEYNKTNE